MTGRGGEPDWWRRARRRADAVALRWHARLDSDWSDRSLPLILAGAAFVTFAALAVARVRSLEPSAPLATWVQASWLVGQRLPAQLTVAAPPGSLAEAHGALIMYPVGYLCSFLPIANALVVVQSAALAWAILPLWRIARRVVNLRVGAAAGVIAAYSLYPPLHNLNVAGFHPEALAVPALVAMVYRASTGSVVRLGFAAFVAVLCRADYALVVVAFGMLTALRGGRRRAGTALALGGLLWGLAAIFVDWLGAGDGWLAEPGAFSQYGQSITEVIGWFFRHPIDAAAATFSHADVAVLAALVLPLAFLPFLSFRYLWPVVPLQLAYLAGNYPADDYLTSLAVPVLAFGFVATAFGLGRTGRPTLERVGAHPKVTAALVAASMVFFLLDAPASPYERPWQWGSRDAVDRARLDLIAAVGPGDAVAATADMLPSVAERRTACLLPAPGGQACPNPVDVYLVDRVLSDVPAEVARVGPFFSGAGGRILGYRAAGQPPTSE